MSATPDTPPAELVTDLWFGRRDAWCRQHPTTGQFRAITGTLTPRTTHRHLAGTVCLHAYCLTPPARPGGGETCLWAAFDLDQKAAPDTPGLRAGTISTLTALHTALARHVDERSLLVEATGGRGLHLWVMFRAPVPAVTAVRLMDTALTTAGHQAAATNTVLDGHLSIERNPHTAVLTGRVGQALRVPFGIHPRTGRRSRLINPATGHQITSPTPLLEAIPTTNATDLARRLPAPAPTPAPPPPAPAPPGPPGAHRKPDAWLCYQHLTHVLGLEGRTTRPPHPAATRHGVRCLFPDRHTHQDLTGLGSAYLIRDGDTQLYGCSGCDLVFDTLQLLREALGVTFPEAQAIARSIDPHMREAA